MNSTVRVGGDILIPVVFFAILFPSSELTVGGQGHRTCLLFLLCRCLYGPHPRPASSDVLAKA